MSDDQGAGESDGAVATDPPGPRTPLPRRPRLAPGRPLLWRGRDVLQIGVRPEHALVLEALDQGLVTMVRRIDGARTVDQLVDGAVRDGSDHEVARWLIEELHRHGLLADTVPVPGPLGPDLPRPSDPGHGNVVAELRRRRESVVEVLGGGRIGVAVAVALAVAGVGVVVVRDAEAVLPGDLGTGYQPEDVGRQRAEAAAEAVLRATRVLGAPPVTRRRSSLDPDVVVIADRVVPGPDLATDLVTRGVPHLPAHAAEGVVVVGPLVVPGSTGCLRCADLHRGDIDPAWPKVVAQLSGRLGAADLTGASVAAAFAADQVLTLLGGPDAAATRPASWGTALEIDPTSAELRRVHRPAHPACACNAGRRATRT